MKKKGCGKFQVEFDQYWMELEGGLHDEVCPYYFAGKYGCTVRHARELIKNKVKVVVKS